MKTVEGYSKEKYTDDSVLLAGGGAKALSNFIGALSWDSTNKKITYTPVGGSATDLVSLSWSNISGKPDTFPASAHDHDDKYLKLSGGDVTGPIYRKMVADTSNFELVVGFKKQADDTVLASIGYHNTVQKIFINAIGSNTIYSDTEGKYSLVIGNNHLTYNTKSIWHAGNYTDWINTTNYPGLDKVGTVTSITLKAGTGISLDTDNTAITSSGTRTITNAGVRAVTINGNALRVNTNGTNDDLTIPYATSASDSTKVAGYSVAFNKLYYKSKEVTMTTVQAYWYVKISLSAYAQPTQIFVSCSYNNEIDRAIIEFSGMSGGFIYRNCNQNQGNIKGIWFAGAASPWAFWLKFDKILNTSALHYSPSSSATCTVYLADNNASFNVEATTTEPSGASWISTGDASNNIIIRNAYVIGSIASADYATSAGSATTAGSASYADSAGSASSATDADKVDGYHASDLVKFYLSPMTSNAPADSAKSWFTGTMPSSSGAIVYNVPGSEKTIIAGKSSGSYGHMLQLSYDDNYLRMLRYKAGSWQSTDWEKISAGAADTVKTAAYSPSSNVVVYPTFVDSSNSTADYESVYTYGNLTYYPYVDNFNVNTIRGTWVGNFGKVLAYYTKSITGTVSTYANTSYLSCADGFSGYIQKTGTGTYKVSLTNTSTNKQSGNYQTVQCVITPVYTDASYEMAMINFATYSTSVSKGNSCTWTFYTKRLHCQGSWSTSDFVQLIDNIGFTLIIFGYGTGWGVKRDDG